MSVKSDADTTLMVAFADVLSEQLLWCHLLTCLLNATLQFSFGKRAFPVLNVKVELGRREERTVMS